MNLEVSSRMTRFTIAVGVIDLFVYRLTEEESKMVEEKCSGQGEDAR